jgi:competence protein ComEA
MYFSRGEQIVIGLCVLGLLVAGGVWLYTTGSRADRGEEETLLTLPPVPPVEEEPVVLVHICGEVRRPGVYRVKPTNRVLEVIKLAGGATAQADVNALNLAAFVQDGERIYVPTQAEAQAALVAAAVAELRQAADERGARSPKSSSPSKSTSSSKSPPPPRPRGKININTATAAQLDLLPGVGPSIARRIIDYRRKNGGFRKPEDLVEVAGIGEKTFERMRPYVTVSP